MRLVCLNDRFASYSFTFTRKIGERYDFEWKKFGSGMDAQTESSGDGVTTADTARALDELLASKGFRDNPTQTLPVAVGNPYVYFIEAVHDGQYQAIYRDMPGASWKERKFVEFNRIATRKSVEDYFLNEILPSGCETMEFEFYDRYKHREPKKLTAYFFDKDSRDALSGQCYEWMAFTLNEGSPNHHQELVMKIVESAIPWLSRYHSEQAPSGRRGF